MSRSSKSKSTSSQTREESRTENWDALRAVFKLDKSHRSSKVLARTRAFMVWIVEEVGPHLNVAKNLHAGEVIESVMGKVDRAREKLAPYSGHDADSSLSKMVQGAISTLKAERNGLRLANEEINVVRAEYNTAKSTISTLEMACRLASDDYEQLKGEIAASENERNVLAGRIEALRLGLNTLAAHLGVQRHASTSDRVESLMAKLVATAEEEEGFYRKALGSVGQRQDDAVAEANQNVVHLQEARAALQDSYDRLRNQFDDQHDAYNRLRIDFDNNRTRYDEERAISADFRNEKDQVASIANFYNPEPGKLPSIGDIRKTKQFRDAVTYIWQHLCDEFWSTRPDVDPHSQIILSAGAPRHQAWRLSALIAVDESGQKKKQDLDVELSCIFALADQVWGELHHAKCSAYISRTLGQADKPAILSPLVIVRSASNLSNCFGQGFLLKIA
ncbi:hypothetical protein BJY01DRAFT_138958 [Aspergillus pseudoustus]|uniref:Fungal N-terminal domain-containing protein n=1 Tax=Aspergillus pseudoustus TaxID=1810923 RepID=A0ABR4KCF4_9EURO